MMMQSENKCDSCQCKQASNLLNVCNWNKALVAVLRKIKSTLNSDGCWKGEYDRWNAIVAVCNLETMLTFGVDMEETWQVSRNDNGTCCVGPKNVVGYLCNQICKLGNRYSFGEDTWDLLRLVLVIKKMQIEKEFSGYKSIEKYCLQLCEDTRKLTIQNQWGGPAILALAVELCELCKKTEQKNALLETIMSGRNEDGSWGDPQSDSMCIWHTAQVLNVLSMSNTEVKRSVDCIIFHMNKLLENNDELLKDYYLAYGIWALYKNGYQQESIFINTVSDIKNRLESDKISDRGGLSMIGTILSRMFTGSVREIDAMEMGAQLREYKDANMRLLEENEQLKKSNEKYADGGLYIPKRTVKIIGWFLGVVLSAVITTIITLAVTHIIGD